MGAIEYIDVTLGAGGNDGTTWADAWRTDPTALASALASVDAGGTIYIHSDNTLTYSGNITLGSTAGVAGNPCTIVSVVNTASEPPVAGEYDTMMNGGGSLDADDGAFDIILNGWDIWIGIHFKTGDDFGMTTAEKSLKIINCQINCGDDLTAGNTAEEETCWENVDLIVEGGAATLNVLGDFAWRGGTLTFGGGGGVFVNFMTLSIALGGNVVVEDVDLQDLDAGDYLVSSSLATHDVLFKRCKIPAAVNYMDTGPIGPSCKVRFHSCSSDDNIYNFKEFYFEGMIEEATNCKLTGDWSAKMVTDKTNTIEWSRPLRFKLAEIYAAANATVTVNVIHDQQGSGAGSDLQDDEFWIEVESPLASAQLMFGQITSSRPATILTAPADLSNNAEGWTEDLANDVKQEAAVTVGAGGAGIYTVWACLAIEATVYVDPIPVIS